jgi:hypothetical protein
MWNVARETAAGIRSDDGWLGPVLIATWALRTGRTLPRDVPCAALSVDELITFWADPWLDTPPPRLADRALPLAPERYEPRPLTLEVVPV